MLLQFDLKHIHKVNFYPSDNNFTQALLVLLVTNMISDVLFSLSAFAQPLRMRKAPEERLLCVGGWGASLIDKYTNTQLQYKYKIQRNNYKYTITTVRT